MHLFTTIVANIQIPINILSQILYKAMCDHVYLHLYSDNLILSSKKYRNDVKKTPHYQNLGNIEGMTIWLESSRGLNILLLKSKDPEVMLFLHLWFDRRSLVRKTTRMKIFFRFQPQSRSQQCS